MKGYGLPRNWDVEYPDVADIHFYGRPGHVRRTSDAKARARRIWKKIARQNDKNAIRNETF